MSVVEAVDYAESSRGMLGCDTDRCAAAGGVVCGEEGVTVTSCCMYVEQDTPAHMFDDE